MNITTTMEYLTSNMLEIKWDIPENRTLLNGSVITKESAVRSGDTLRFDAYDYCIFWEKRSFLAPFQCIPAKATSC